MVNANAIAANNQNMLRAWWFWTSDWNDVSKVGNMHYTQVQYLRCIILFIRKQFSTANAKCIALCSALYINV